MCILETSRLSSRNKNFQNWRFLLWKKNSKLLFSDFCDMLGRCLRWKLAIVPTESFLICQFATKTWFYQLTSERRGGHLQFKWEVSNLFPIKMKSCASFCVFTENMSVWAKFTLTWSVFRMPISQEHYSMYKTKEFIFLEKQCKIIYIM